jgi:hypothetical protein
MRIKTLALLLTTLLAAQMLLGSPVFSGKPKVEVRVRVNEGLGKYPPQDTLNKYNSPVAGPLQSAEIFYFNVTVLSDNAEATAQNNGNGASRATFT